MKHLRLSPTSSSRRVLALEFIKRYFCEHGASPSFGEIAAVLGVPIQRVSAIVRDLEQRGELLRTPGRSRGLSLPEAAEEMSTSDVMLILKRRGWIVDHTGMRMIAPGVTNPQLTVPPELDDIP